MRARPPPRPPRGERLGRVHRCASEGVLLIFPRAIPTGIAHGTVTVVLANKRHYEVTTLRGESALFRRPPSRRGPLDDDITADLARRDFTVNAIAVDLADGKVIDPFDGRKDLEARVLRAVGDPLERFSEDGLRVLRAARFVATLDLELDDATNVGVAPTLRSTPTARWSAEQRVHDEWVKTMKAQTPIPRAFEVMRRTEASSA